MRHSSFILHPSSFLHPLPNFRTLELPHFRTSLLFLLISSFSLNPFSLLLSSTADFGTLRDGHHVVTNEQDATALAALNLTNAALHASFTNEALYRAQGDAAVTALLTAGTNLLDQQLGPRIAANASAITVSHTNLLDHFTQLVLAETSARATNVTAWADFILADSRAYNAATRAIAAQTRSEFITLTTNRPDRVYGTNATQWIDGNGVKWQVTYTTNTFVGVTFSADFGGPNGGNRPSASTLPFPFAEYQDNIQDADHYWHGYWSSDYPYEGYYVVEFNGGEGLWLKQGFEGGISPSDDFPAHLMPSTFTGTGTATVDTVTQILCVTSPVDTVAFLSEKELHPDSFTNLIWKTVWSNGWCWAVAYTNTPLGEP